MGRAGSENTSHLPAHHTKTVSIRKEDNRHMIWVITGIILVLWLPLYFAVYYEDKASIAPGCMMTVYGPCLALGPGLLVAFAGVCLSVAEWEVIAPVAVSFLTPLLMMLGHDRWDTRRDREIEIDRCTNVLGMGYEGETLESFTKWLGISNVAAVVDIRADTTKGVGEFTKDNLTKILSEHGVQYVHLPTLGNPQDNQAGFHSDDTEEWYAAQARYQKILDGEMAQQAISYVRTLARSVYDREVILLCTEKRQMRCHRGVLLSRVREGEKRFILKTNQTLWEESEK